MYNKKIFCTECGEELIEGANFCAKCGNSLNNKNTENLNKEKFDNIPQSFNNIKKNKKIILGLGVALIIVISVFMYGFIAEESYARSVLDKGDVTEMAK